VSFLEECHIAHIERCIRLSQRAPEAGPMRFKPKPKIIILDKKGQQHIRQQIMVIPKKTKPRPLPELLIPGRITVHQIMRAVGATFNVRIPDLLAHDRREYIVLPRQVVMYVARQLTKYSLPEIGRYLGGRDHTTVLYGLRKVTRLVADDPILAAKIDEIKDAIKSQL
jgi:hypothetical protein